MRASLQLEDYAVEKRFRDKFIVKRGHWIWIAGVNPDRNGTPSFFLRGRNHNARRVAYILFSEKKVHEYRSFSVSCGCGVTLCVRPEHTVVSGAHSGGGKLTDEEVKAIRLLAKTERYTHYKLSRFFRVSRPAITLVVRGGTYHGVRDAP